MAEFGSESSIGARIKAARRARGIKSIREFSELLEDPTLTESVLENIEAGRKADLPISAVLNIARALRVPPAFLLVAITAAGSPDLPNLSPALRAMTSAEFDAWLAGEGAGAYRTTDPAERNDLAELEAFRELGRARQELEREQITGTLGSPSPARVELLERRTAELTDFLRSAGWQL